MTTLCEFCVEVAALVERQTQEQDTVNARRKWKHTMARLLLKCETECVKMVKINYENAKEGYKTAKECLRRTEIKLELLQVTRECMCWENKR
jgi:hypothetical protein